MINLYLPRVVICVALTVAMAALSVFGTATFAADPGSPSPIKIYPVDKPKVLTWPTANKGKRVTLRRPDRKLRVRVLNTDILVDVLTEYMAPFKPGYGRKDAQALVDKILDEEIEALKQAGFSTETDVVPDAGFQHFRHMSDRLTINLGELVILIGNVDRQYRYPEEKPFAPGDPPRTWSNHMKMLVPSEKTLPANQISFIPDQTIQLLSENNGQVGKALCVFSPYRLSYIYRRGGKLAETYGIEGYRQFAYRRLNSGQHPSFVGYYRRMWPDDNFVRWTENFPEKYLKLFVRGCLASSVGLNLGMSPSVPIEPTNPIGEPYSSYLGMQRIEQQVEPINKAWDFVKELYPER